MVNLDLGTIEQAIKAAMAEQIKNGHWRWVKEIKTYGGEFDDDLLEIVKIFPAIWISFVGSGSPEKISYNKIQYPITFVVLVGSRSVRNEESRRHGAGTDIGTYTMLKNVQELLIENDLSSQNIQGLAPLKLGKTKTIFNTKTRGQSISVLSQEFTTQYVITASERDREEALTDTIIERINFDYVFEQSGVPIASDLVELKEGN
ncbi:hypothetical protein B9T31_04155 [Acinetobacter sp. ANC 4558]|uniref:phage protein Gp37 n=1 Tax=Acinetobacter sp. ANC 4558 TaxID=1977876 RepID=UPI000A34EAD0|nr:phage protein Gp37 [Acinetobacter sp. ANC 4558]OTG87698.1 hypothetical protein B9T31_04155 [Acinetobacter sp. ANC 4558]